MRGACDVVISAWAPRRYGYAGAPNVVMACAVAAYVLMVHAAVELMVILYAAMDDAVMVCIGMDHRLVASL